MNTDPLTILRMVAKGPCHELDSAPFWSLSGVKERGWIEPYAKTSIPHYGPSTKWTLSPEGRAELKRLEAQEAAPVGREQPGISRSEMNPNTERKGGE